MRNIVLFCIVLGIFFVVRSEAAAPAVIIPGLSASALWGHEFPGVGQTRRWVEIDDILPFPLYKDYLATEWDDSDNMLVSSNYIQYYPGLEGVCNISGNGSSSTARDYSEFSDLVNAIHANGGHVGAVPYDWRLVPSKYIMDDFVNRLRSEILALSAKAQNQKVWIIAHSLGNLMTMYFLDQINQTYPGFASSYIAGYMAVAPPYGGAGLGLKAIITGVKEDAFITFPADFLGEIASFPWVFPSVTAFQDQGVLFWNNTWYYPGQLHEFVNAYDFDAGSIVQKIYSRIISTFDYSIFSSKPVDLDTNQLYLFISQYEPTCTGVGYIDNQWITFVEQSDETPKWGDGTVPRQSLTVNVKAWGIPQTQIMDIDVSFGVDHSAIIRFQAFKDRVIQLTNLPQFRA